MTRRASNLFRNCTPLQTAVRLDSALLTVCLSLFGRQLVFQKIKNSFRKCSKISNTFSRLAVPCQIFGFHVFDSIIVFRIENTVKALMRLVIRE